jgi:CO/xanthine dehydrogenase Mo-binding subunit
LLYCDQTRKEQTFQYVHLPGTVYCIPAIDLQVAAALTNTTPIGVTCGPGFAEAVNIIERLIERAGARLPKGRVRHCSSTRSTTRPRVSWLPARA